jgi:hypothetical protein
VAEWLSDTVTCTANGLPLLVVGVPLIMPVAATIVSPLGKPVADQVYVPPPPVAVTVVPGYAALAVPTGSVDGAETARAASTTRV